MTCVVGIVGKDGYVYMGADSCASDSDNAFSISRQKIFMNGPLMFGFAGSYRLGDIIEHGLKIQQKMATAIAEAAEKENNAYEVTGILVRDILPQILKTLDGYGYIKTEGENSDGIIMLVGVGSYLFTLQSDFSLLPAPQEGTAIGTGDSLAIGALTYQSLFTKETDAGLIALKALRTSGAVAHSVCGPYYIYRLEGTAKNLIRHNK